MPLIRKVFVAFEITRGVKIVEAAHVVKLDRPIMFPDVIGEHCLIPNAELLLESHDSMSLRLILESNEKRREEIRDEGVRREWKGQEKSGCIRKRTAIDACKVFIQSFFVG